MRAAKTALYWATLLITGAVIVWVGLLVLGFLTV